jgi:WD40 repeat protein
VWWLETQAQITVLEAHDKPVLALSFHPAGTLLASASGDNTVRLWGVPVDTGALDEDRLSPGVTAPLPPIS